MVGEFVADSERIYRFLDSHPSIDLAERMRRIVAFYVERLDEDS